MNLQAEKIKLIEWLVSIEDTKLIEKISSLRVEYMDQVSEEEKRLLDGRLQSHKDQPSEGSEWNGLKAELQR